MTLEGKRVLITGASRGVGQALALDFAEAGARVAVNYQSSGAAAKAVVNQIVAAGGDAIAVRADVGQGADVAAMFAEVETRFGGLDVLINNAGINRDGPFVDMSEDDWDTVIATNLKGPFLCCQAAARLMSKGAGGRIINISAVTALQGRALAANYIASKGGVDALTRALSVELGPKITVNSIALGFFDSPLLRDLFTPERIAEVGDTLPSGRIGQFADVAALARYLASDASGFMTGQTLSLDGGQAIRLA